MRGAVLIVVLSTDLLNYQAHQCDPDVRVAICDARLGGPRVKVIRFGIVVAAWREISAEGSHEVDRWIAPRCPKP